MHSSLHCSVIGTCLSTGELRQVLGRLGLAPREASDHELHGTGVRLAAKHDQAARLLHKALDSRHHLTINRFAKVAQEDAVGALWREAVGRGDIPGAYWALLTHPATTSVLVREAFGEVHMLSHLVGSANRADIRRLKELEIQECELLARLERQQRAFREVVQERDETIRVLRHAISARVTAEPLAASETRDEVAALRSVIADLERRLGVETRRRAGAEARAATAQEALDRDRQARRECEAEIQMLSADLAVLESGMADPGGTDGGDPQLGGTTVLYVGGRANQVSHLRAASGRLGAAFLHHDGGKEQHIELLAGLVSQADHIVFPVDCISHDAMLNLKRHCQQLGRPYTPLRSSGLAAFVAAMQRRQAPGAREIGAE